MSEAVVVALITAAFGAVATITSQVIISNRSAKDRDAKDAARQQETKDQMIAFDKRLDDVEKKLDEHNGYAEKFAESAVVMAKMQKDIEYLRRGQ